MDFEIDSKWNGKTVLLFLIKELGLSSKMIAALKKKELGIVCNGERVTVRRILKNKDLLSIDTSDSEASENIIPSPLLLDVVYEDEYILVTNKPPYMPTHPSHGHFDDTLANAVCHHMQKQNPNIHFVFRPINRLDKNTSGLVLIAKDKISAGRLYSAMQKGEITKKYIALLDGKITPPYGKIETYIKRTAESIITREVCEEGSCADYAKTEYKTLSAFDGHCVVLASPITGRTHQLRVHFAHLGCPITGDDMYGNQSDKIARQALHAAFLSFPHPISQEQMAFTAPIPKDMSVLIPKQCNPERLDI